MHIILRLEQESQKLKALLDSALQNRDFSKKIEAISEFNLSDVLKHANSLSGLIHNDGGPTARVIKVARSLPAQIDNLKKIVRLLEIQITAAGLSGVMSEPSVSTSSGSTPVSTSSGSTPVGTSSGSTPVGTSSGSTLVGTSSGSTPVSTSSGSTPVSTSSSSTPVSTSSGSTPVSTSSGSTPVSTSSGSTPVSTSSGSTPVSTSSGSTPVSTSSGSTAPQPVEHKEDPRISAIRRLKEALQPYRNKTEGRDYEYYYGLLGTGLSFFGMAGYSKTQKLNSINKLLANVDGSAPTELTEEDKLILSTGTLGQDLNPWLENEYIGTALRGLLAKNNTSGLEFPL